MEEIIKIEDMTYYYNSFDDEGKAVKSTGCEQVNLSVFKGEFLALVGHNGSGKSTLARLMNALLLPKKGKIFVLGMDTSKDENLFEIRKTVGMVFQNPDNQMVASIVKEDVAFGPENLGVPSEEIVQRVEQSLKSVNMWEYADRSPHKLSGGQKQRIAIAGALALCPQVLVLDESTAMLDPKGRAEVLDTARKLNKEQGITVVLITHFMEEVFCADRVAVMNKGRVVRVASPTEIFSDEKLIDSVGLALPRITKLNKLLYDGGMGVSPYADSPQCLAEELCRLLK